jgi:hypothetical protein
MIDEGPSGVPDIDLVDLDISSPSQRQRRSFSISELKMIVAEEIEGAQWTITYLEQRNKQLEDEKALDELRRIRSDRT